MEAIEGEPIDISKHDRDVWLVKTPHFIDERWRNSQGGANAPVARIRYSINPLEEGARPEFSLHLLGDLKQEAPRNNGAGAGPARHSAASSSKGIAIPRSYKLHPQQDPLPMQVFSQLPQGPIAAEGVIKEKYDLRPTDGDHAYKNLFQHRIEKSMNKTRQLQVLGSDRGLMHPLPVSEHARNKAKLERGVKPSDMKRDRMEKGALEELVFKLFEGQSHWTLKDLVSRSKQPVAFLKEVLSELCAYNKRGAHQGTYELKPEYVTAAQAANGEDQK